MANKPPGALWIYNPVRPNDLDDNYPSAFAIDIKGGHHMYATLAERGIAGGAAGIKEARREWGMLCTIYNDPDPKNNGVYQLVYNASSPNIIDNLNWRVFSGSPQISSSGEWLPSVGSIVDTPPLGGFTGGDRFLISNPSYAEFATQSDKVAQWDSSALSGAGDWIYTTPTNGSTVRVDNINNTLFKFLGTWSEGGYWQREYLSQIRYIQPTSIDGSTYSFTTSTDLVSLDAYSYSVYYANFGMTNSGSSTLQIDGLGYYPLKKLNGGSLLDVEAQDLVPEVQYHLSWNVNSFLIHNIGGGGSFSGVIGPPEDTTYSDGLFQDFTESTPIGVPIDRFNEILLALVPPPAPDLQNWSLGGPQFVNGKLSFDSTVPAGLIFAPGVSRGDDFNSSVFRKGINSFVSQPRTSTYFADYVGTLNFGVQKGPGDPTPAYATSSFGNGITGSLVLKLNGVTISNESLVNKAAINTTSGGFQSGLIISAATSSKFPSGVPFEFFWHRTGSFLIKTNDVNLRQGFNYLDLSHVLPSQTLTLASYSWVADPSTASTTFTGRSVNTINGFNAKYLSGIQFWQNLSLIYQVTLTNHVRNTFVGSNALSSSSTEPGGVNGINNKVTSTNTPVMPAPVSKSISSVSGVNPASPSISETINWNYSLGTSVRRLNESITFNMSVLRTVQGTDLAPAYTEGNFFVDNVPESSTLTTENFTSETNRLLNGSTKYASLNDVVQSFNAWDSKKSIYLDAPHRNGLQVLGGQLVYPGFTYGLVGSATKNPNFNSGSDVNYFLCNTIYEGFGTYSGAPLTNNRTFTRKFQVNSANNYTVLKFNISFTNTSFVNSNTTLDGNNCWIEVKLPKDTTQPNPGVTPALIGAALTGWLDMTKNFRPEELWANGAGANATTSFPTTSGADWLVSFGGKGTGFSGGWVVLRITAPATWQGSINSILVAGSK